MIREFHTESRNHGATKKSSKHRFTYTIITYSIVIYASYKVC